MDPNHRRPTQPTSEDLAAFQSHMDGRELAPTVIIRDPGAADLETVAPRDRWLDLDTLVAVHGTRFTRWGKHFDITEAVAGQLGRGRVALLVFEDPTTPRQPSPEERRVLGLD